MLSASGFGAALFQGGNCLDEAFLERGPQLANLLVWRQVPAKTAVTVFRIAVEFDGFF